MPPANFEEYVRDFDREVDHVEILFPDISLRCSELNMLKVARENSFVDNLGASSQEDMLAFFLFFFFFLLLYL